ncbi:hypothetical protein B0H19DRAFT_1241854 [Mycena capillaripes]|nr:hypothetical protein B0H19DRAFT_1241854 [Mycena capillaripes]
MQRLRYLSRQFFWIGRGQVVKCLVHSKAARFPTSPTTLCTMAAGYMCGSFGYPNERAICVARGCEQKMEEHIGVNGVYQENGPLAGVTVEIIIVLEIINSTLLASDVLWDVRALIPLYRQQIARLLSHWDHRGIELPSFLPFMRNYGPWF